jgi:hypothetical protein
VIRSAVNSSPIIGSDLSAKSKNITRGDSALQPGYDTSANYDKQDVGAIYIDGIVLHVVFHSLLLMCAKEAGHRHQSEAPSIKVKLAIPIETSDGV